MKSKFNATRFIVQHVKECLVPVPRALQLQRYYHLLVCELTRLRKALLGPVPIPFSPEHHNGRCNSLFALKTQDCSTMGYDILGRAARCLNASECPCHSKFWTCQGSIRAF